MKCTRDEELPPAARAAYTWPRVLYRTSHTAVWPVILRYCWIPAAVHRLRRPNEPITHIIASMAPVVPGGGVIARVTWVTEVFKVRQSHLHLHSSACVLPLGFQSPAWAVMVNETTQMMKFGVVDNGLLIIMMMAGVNRECTLSTVCRLISATRLQSDCRRCYGVNMTAEFS